MIENALKGFVEALEDPYTSYMDKQESSGLNEELKGEQDFEGI
jgi:C-terminal processing protease CtpA/Prc